MIKQLAIGLMLLSPLGALGQRPPALIVFTDPGGAFQFVYSENYELLVGERILRATQGRHAGIPVCEFSTALVCVIYPVERLEDTKFEAAGFSVHTLPSFTMEADCQSFKDRVAKLPGEELQPISLTINDRSYRHVIARKTVAGHSQSEHLYRTFHKDRCYELRIAVTVPEDGAGSPSSSRSAAESEANSARESLKLILASVVFR
jgi:hypothetical protein